MLRQLGASGFAGSLPLRVAGSVNLFNEPSGNPRAGFLYPRVGSIPDDSGRRRCPPGPRR